MLGDQIHFLSLAAILTFGTINTFFFKLGRSKPRGELFWLWGMGCLAISCLGFGLGPYAGRVALAIANFSLLLSYFCLSLQLRYWKSGKFNIPMGLIAGTLAYMLVIETMRYLDVPYALRGGIIHGTMSILLSYLLWSTAQLYQRNRYPPLIMLGLSFLVEASCALTRTILPIVQEMPETMNWFTEESWMIVARWIWATTNATTYLAIMMYQLEKTTSKSEGLESLIAEKEQLLRATTMVSRTNNASLLTGSIMHELRQPLSSILLGSVSLKQNLSLAHSQPEPTSTNHATLSRYADIIERESMRSVTIMNRLEKIYSPDRNTYQKIFLPELVESALQLIDQRIQNHQIKLEKVYQSSGEVVGDTLQIESVVTNLVSNAVKALSDSRHPRIIKISVKEHDQQVLLEVKDNGTGIDPAMLPHIFSLFVTQAEGGMGIGLWLSRIIMENHHGDIQCRNMTGGGAAFTVRFPITT